MRSVATVKTVLVKTGILLVFATITNFAFTQTPSEATAPKYYLVLLKRPAKSSAAKQRSRRQTAGGTYGKHPHDAC
jgi:hypothetical protein